MSLKKLMLALGILAAACMICTTASFAGVITDGEFSTENAYYVEGDLNSENDENSDTASLQSLMEGEGDVDFNWDAIFKVYDSLEPIDTVLNVENSGGTTEYFDIELIANVSGADWTDYHVELGYYDWTPEGGENTFFPFSEIDSEELDLWGLDFDTPDKDPAPDSFWMTSSIDDPVLTQIFSTVQHNDYTIDWLDGTIPSLNIDPEDIDEDELELLFGDLAWVTYSMDIPDAFEQGSEGYEFVIRQYPTIDELGDQTNVIPEPASMLLLGSGLLGGVFFRRKRKI